MANPSRWDMKSGDVLGFRLPTKTHTSLTLSHDEPECDTRQEPAESDHEISNSNAAGPLPTQQSTVDRAHQLDIRPESVNPDILSSTAKLAVDSGWFDHCCPLEFATQFELKEGRFVNASAVNTIKLEHYGTGVVEGWT